ncbi:molecular chaperone DnaJ [Chondromyces apiculatus]|uniref:Chaperone protein DnaJ n=1 Tax=Chondromyces apiculatus DSM 436 TaxID=1192034 RepID=A0A017THH7_9BACT|nr:molecular chaperone DnaJ [Chondromyces apiculatus]EYF08733.1 Chaperone protein DnaJ [Chondromyces apiculatus DSM 436]
MRDPYDVLSVARSATQDEIKGAFRKLAAQHHPDRNPDDPGAQQRFKEINAAYQILSDPQKRAAFDRFGPAMAGGTTGPFQGVPFDMNDLNLDAIFGDLLGALGFRQGDRGTLQKEVRISFEEAAFGCTKDVTYERVESCVDCSGTGSAPGSTPDRCSACSGRGRVRVQQGVLPIAIERPCSRCRGTGRIVIDPCTTCRGAGLVTKERTIEVTIPPGVENGATRLVERGGNAPRPDRAAGDLELTVRVAPHDLFRRVGDDIVCTMPISFPQAALGGELQIPTLDGKGKLKIPAGTQPGTVLRVKGKGIPRRVMGGRGDQLVEVTVEVPTKLTAHQKELIAQLAQEMGEGVHPQDASFMDKLKGLFG